MGDNLENFSSSLIEVFNLEKNSIISVSGSGGKTTFCKGLSLELYKKYLLNKKISILFSTTTKIGDFYDKNYKKILFDSEDKIDMNLFKKVEGLYLTGIKFDRKISSLPLKILEDLVNKFSFIDSKVSIGKFIILAQSPFWKDAAKFNITTSTNTSIACENKPFSPFNAISFVLENTPKGIRI